MPKSKNKPAVILRVSLKLSSTSYELNVRKLMVTESAKTYSISDDEDLPFLHPKRIKKEDLLVPVTPLADSHCMFLYRTFCLPQDVEEAKKVVRERLNQQVYRIHDEFTSLWTMFENRPPVETIS